VSHFSTALRGPSDRHGFGTAFTVIAAVNGEPTVKRLSFEDDKVLLLPENPEYKPILIDPEEGIKMLGVITFTIHPLRGSNGVRRRLSGLQ
jgi:hypothetical protein